MSVANLSPHPKALSLTAKYSRDVLAEALGGVVDIYCWTHEWCLECDNRVTARNHELRSQVFAVPGDQQEPVIAQFQDEACCIIPFETQEGRFLAVASDAQKGIAWFEAVARLAQQNLELQLRCKASEGQTTASPSDTELESRPVAPNSGFLENVVHQLNAVELEYCVSDVAEIVLRNLSEAINAQSIAIVPKSTSSRDAFVSVGDPIGDLAEWERVVESHWEPSSEAPAYHRVCGVAYSSVQNFVIAPIRMGGSLFGWLVADIDTSGRSADKKLILSRMKMSATIVASYAFADERLKHKEQLLLDVVRSLVSAIDAKDPQTCGHSVRVAIYASVVAEGLALTKQECEEVYLSGLLHDVGKIGVPEAIFHKTTSLTDEEFELVKQHPDHGWKILHRLEDLQHILPGVVHHHESFDGTGYPDQVAGKDIPLAARILAAVDAYDALTSERPYRKGKSHAEAMQILRDGAGVQWDPTVVDALQEVSRRIERVSRKYRREAHPWRIPGGIDPHQEVTGDSTSVPTTETTSRYDAYGVDRM